MWNSLFSQRDRAGRVVISIEHSLYHSGSLLFQQKNQFKENLDYERWLTLVLTGIFVTDLQQCHICGGIWLKEITQAKIQKQCHHLILGIFKPHICQGAAGSWRLRPGSVLPCRCNQDCPAGVQQQPAKFNFMYPMFMTTWHLPAGDTLGGCRASQAGESNVFPSSHHSSLALASTSALVGMASLGDLSVRGPTGQNLPTHIYVHQVGHWKVLHNCDAEQYRGRT